LSLAAGLLVWHVGNRFLNEFSSSLRAELRQGTLEQNCLTQIPVIGILSARAWTSMVFNILWGLLVMIPAYGLLWSTRGVPTGIELPAPELAAIVLAFGVTLLGLQGLGLMLGALVLRAKSVGLVATVLGWALLFFTGVLFSPDRYPVMLWQLAQLLPVTHGVGVW